MTAKNEVRTNGGISQQEQCKPEEPKSTHKTNIPTKEDLWKGADLKTLRDNPGWIVEMTGLDSKTHTVYARAVQTTGFASEERHPRPSVLQVVDSVVDVAWKHVARHILEHKQKRNKDDEILRVDLDHWDQGAYPPGHRLLELGAVWLVNETSFLQSVGKGKKYKHRHTKKKRLTHPEEDGAQQPDWNDYVLRVHYAPNRYHAMEEVDWAKYCRGLLLGDQSVQVWMNGILLAAHDHVPLSGYPDAKDGTIVYENAEHGFCVLNKPGTVPDHATVNNHAEDVLTVFSRVLQEREQTAKVNKPVQKKDDPFYNHHHHKAAHLSLPLPLDTETQGLIVIATKRAFANYLTHLVEHPPKQPTDANRPPVHGVMKLYKCLICVKAPEDMLLLNNLQESATVLTHYYHHNPNHKHHTNFVKEIPANQHPHEYGVCQIRLVKIGTNHGLYAANVTSDESVGDAHLAQLLWGLGVQNHSKTPAEDLGIAYVAQLEVEHLVDAEQLHSHLNRASRLTPQAMICGQFAALGFPIVGDTVHGGGTSEVWGHRHGWNRLALQCCEWSFPQPYWKAMPTVGGNNGVNNNKGANNTRITEPKSGVEEKKVEETKDSTGNKKKKPSKELHQQPNGKELLLPSRDNRCVFRLNEAWWNPLLDQYHVDGF